jgi:hypothetical protein
MPAVHKYANDYSGTHLQHVLGKGLAERVELGGQKKHIVGTGPCAG